MSALRVLITNPWMWPPSGTVVYVRDVALELTRQGHDPIVFSSTRGPIVKELRDAGVTVTDRLHRVGVPDVIHANHRAPFLIAIRRWPTVPAIYVCHTPDPRLDTPPLHPGVHRYFGVSRRGLRRLLDAGVREDQAGLLLNFVDTARFRPRGPLPEHPRRALIFGNYAQTKAHLQPILDACRETGIQVDVVGEGVNAIVTSPEALLPRYDLVFAKGKAAIEAMAVGNAVVLCDHLAAGAMVTAARFDELRAFNFAGEALGEPLRREPLVREIARYDAADAASVQERIRSTASLTAAVEQLVRIYQEVLAEQPKPAARPPSASRWQPPLLRQWIFLRLFWIWYRIPRRRREVLKALPGVQGLITAVRRLA